MSTTLLGSTMPRRLLAIVIAAMFGLILAVNPLSAPKAEAAGPSGAVIVSPVTARVSSEFGMRFHPILHIWRLHAGMDFAAPCGTPVRAAAAGTISSAGWAGGYGNRVVITHGIQRGVVLTTTYNHLSRFAVTGGKVAPRRIIGYVGTTGSSTGCHLHFETRQNGTPVNPRIWFSNTAFTQTIQRAVRITADGVWGPATTTATNAVITRNLSNVRYLQARVGVAQNGVWGATAQAAWVVTIKRLQAAIGVPADGEWGPRSRAAWAAK
jgi:murein DD-endopeptidase MepM/ murein hydrolase activator NlpD